MKMRQLKKILSITLASAMLVTSMPVGVSAGEVVEQTTETPPETPTETPKTTETPPETPTETPKTTETPTSTTPDNGSQNSGNAGGSEGESNVNDGSGNGSNAQENQDATNSNDKDQTGGGSQTATGGSESAGEKTEDGTVKKETGTPTTDSAVDDSKNEGEISESVGNNTNTPTDDTNGDQNGENAGGSEGEDNKGEDNKEKEEEDEASKTEITITWVDSNQTTFIWDGTVQHPNATVSGTDNEITYVITQDGTEIKAVEPGSYTVTASVEGVAPIETNFTITKATIDASSLQWTWPEDAGVKDFKTQYTGAAIPLPEVSFKGKEDETVSVSVSKADEAKLSGGNIVNADSYQLVAKLSDDQFQHYQFTDEKNTVEKTFTVEKQNITVKWTDGQTEDVTFIYEPDTNQVLTAESAEVQGTNTALTISQTITKAGKKVSDSKDVGKYTVTVEVKDAAGNVLNGNSNYDIQNAERNFFIKQLEVLIIPDDNQNTITYGKTVESIAYDVAKKNGTPFDNDLKGKIKGELGEVLVPTKGTISDAETYTLSLKEDYNKNYNLTLDEEQEHSYTVNKLVVEVVWDDTTEENEGENTSFIYSPDESQQLTATGVKVDSETDIQFSVTQEITKEGSEGSIQNPKDVGTYHVIATVTAKNSDGVELDSDNFTYEKTERTFTIEQRNVPISWSDLAVSYDRDKRKLAWDIGTEEGWNKDWNKAVKDSITITYSYSGSTEDIVDDESFEGFVDANVYTATATISDPNFKIEEQNQERTLTINKLKIEITPSADQSKYYGQDDPTFTYTIGIDDKSVTKDKTSDELTTLKREINNELNTEFSTSDENLIVRSNTEEAARTYEGSLQVAFAGKISANYDIECGTAAFTINSLPVKVVAVQGGVNSKIYGADDPEKYDFTVEIADGIEKGSLTFSWKKKTENSTATEIAANELKELEETKKFSILTRADIDENVSFAHDLVLNGAAKENVANYDIQDVEGKGAFVIHPLSVTVNPDKKQSKIFGQANPKYYTYTIAYKEEETKLTEEKILDELGADLLKRDEGEGIGTYQYQINNEKDRSNFKLTIPEAAPTYEITAIEILDVQGINSRQNKFEVTTDLTGKREQGVSTKFRVEAVEFPTSADGILFSQNIDDFITDASDGIAFKGDTASLKINKVTYQKARKDNDQLLEWDGYLPAGTKIKVSIISEIDGKVVTVSKKPVSVTVKPVEVAINWGAYETSTSTGNYVVSNNGTTNPLTLDSDRTDEWVEILYSKDGNKKTEASYSQLNTTFTPSVNNSGLKHVTQSVTANVVDTLNLTCTAKSLQFYVDDTAFTIPASSIQFENRGEEISIQLPEMGTITSVTIAGAEVEVSGEMAQEFKFPVSWSGNDLVATGAGISVSYTDQAGHQGTGSAAASRSSVSTPITFRIRPELNSNGYLNGRSTTLIVSGTACACEPIQVTVAGMTQKTNATQNEVWSDSNGSWEVLFDMTALPEDEDFSISAEYMDVNGTGYSISARFDAYCASASVISPVYEAMTHISGMVEPGTAVALVINGETQNYYEIDVDRFGRFAMDDVPMMFGGEDSFDIYVTDIAGNVSISHYEIEEPDDPFEVTATVNPLGKYFYSAEETDSVVCAATPVSLSDFAEEEDTIELPLLMGMSYEVGTFTISRTDNGFTVSADLQAGEDIDAEDYRFENEKLYVYTGRPTLDELRNHAGTEYKYGEEITLDEDETVWIVNDMDMTILADDIEDLELYDFDNSSIYEKYQEK